jgi:hypothetical protein
MRIFFAQDRKLKVETDLRISIMLINNIKGCFFYSALKEKIKSKEPNRKYLQKLTINFNPSKVHTYCQSRHEKIKLSQDLNKIRKFAEQFSHFIRVLFYLASNF